MAVAAPSHRLYDVIISNFEDGLRSSALKIAEFGVALKEIGLDPFSVEEFAHVCAIIATIYNDDKVYAMAQLYFDRAISSASRPSSISGAKKPEGISGRDKLYSLCDVKYRKAVCLLGFGCDAEALQLLVEIPEAERSPEARMLVGKLYQRRGKLADAMEQYKSVLKHNCFAVEAAERLAQIGAESEISLFVGADSWLGPWVQSVVHMRRGKFEEAIEVLDASPVFCNIPQGIALKGKAYFYLGNHATAMYLLEKAHKMMPYMMLHMGTLAYLYAVCDTPNKEALDELAKTLRNYSPEHPTALVCSALSLLMSDDFNSAWATVQKVLALDSSNSEANFVAGTIHFMKLRYKEAIGALRLVIAEDPFCFAAHETIVISCMRRKKWAQAKAAARRASKTLGCCASVLALKAEVSLRKYGLGWPTGTRMGTRRSTSLDARNAALNKAEAFLDLAVQKDATYVPAVLLLVEVHCLMGKFDDALELLQTTANHTSMAKLHSMMGDIYIQHKNDEAEALEAYTRALRLDPDDVCANMGLEAIGDPTLPSLSRILDVFGIRYPDDHEATWVTPLSHALVVDSVSGSGSSGPRDSSNSHSMETVHEEDELPDYEEYIDEEENDHAWQESTEQDNALVVAVDGAPGPNFEDDEDEF